MMGKIIGTLMEIMNIVEQIKINKRVEIVDSKRIKYNQSKIFGTGTSVNTRLNKDNIK